MDGDEGRCSIREPMCVAAHPAERHHLPVQAARCRRSQRDVRGGPHNRALVVEPPSAALDFIGVRPLVQPPLAALFELEVLDRMGDEDVAAPDAGVVQRPVENAAGRPDEGLAGEVLLVAGLLAKSISRAFALPSPGTTWVACL